MGRKNKIHKYFGWMIKKNYWVAGVICISTFNVFFLGFQIVTGADLMLLGLLSFDLCLCFSCIVFSYREWVKINQREYNNVFDILREDDLTDDDCEVKYRIIG